MEGQELMNPVEALAESWASIDGYLGQFKEERAIACGPFGKTSVIGSGRYVGYLCEAEEMILRLRARGFDVLPVRPDNVVEFKPVS